MRGVMRVTEPFCFASWHRTTLLDRFGPGLEVVNKRQRPSNFTLQRTKGSRCSPWPLSMAVRRPRTV